MDFDLNRALEILEKTPDVIHTQIQGISDEWLLKDYGPNTWPVHQVIGHLIWGERTDWIPRIKIILEKSTTETFEPFDRNGHSTLCETHTTAELVEMFREERQVNVLELKRMSLSDDDFKKQGVHPAFGKVSMGQLIASWTVHDMNHIAQINKAMAFQFKHPVGPWEQYISILSPPNPR